MATSVPVPTLACYQLGVIRERLDDGKGAVECFERVVEANPRDSSAHYHLGLGYKRLGLEGLAMSAFAEALRLDPSDTAAAEELQSLSANRSRSRPRGPGRPRASCPPADVPSVV